ncbi:hypothetical protein ACFQ08_10380 [Streptosporangium algeriense]|uniref:Uncharacterized protein n=1 Tax=Streptosporangium algeriense TaxID=1682748 RepID=A0ABW3DPM5_9ACTN
MFAGERPENAEQSCDIYHITLSEWRIALLLITCFQAVDAEGVGGHGQSIHQHEKERVMSLKITVEEIKDFQGTTAVTGATLCG